jgi:hypothetical protein
MTVDGPAIASRISARIQHSQPLLADAYQCQPDNTGPRQAYPGRPREWENPQVSDRFSRPGERIGYDTRSLPPV